MNIEKLYNEHFSTLEVPQGTDKFEKQYDYFELISFAKDYHKNQLRKFCMEIISGLIIQYKNISNNSI